MPETIKVERGDLDKMSRAFKQLEPTKERPYEIDAETTWRLAKNETIIDRELKALNRVRSSIYRRLNIMPGVQYGMDRAGDLMRAAAEIEEFEDGEVEIEGILFVKRADLQKKAAVPNSTLSALMPILTE